MYNMFISKISRIHLLVKNVIFNLKNEISKLFFNIINKYSIYSDHNINTL